MTVDSPGWLTVLEAEVPAGDDWLGPHERAVLAGLRIAPRRASWRLGRWAARRALAVWLDGVGTTPMEVLAATDGAPEVWLDGARTDISISISHRSGCALAVVAGPGAVVGCDLELLEARSDAFLREWFSPFEQDYVEACAPADRPLAANLIWTAKEAAAKVRRGGLRLDVRGAHVELPPGAPPADGTWRLLHVAWSDGYGATGGWWRAEHGWVLTVAGEPEMTAPARLLSR